MQLAGPCRMIGVEFCVDELFLEKAGEHTFRRVRKDDRPGEPIVFEMGPDGKALRYIVHSNPYDRRR